MNFTIYGINHIFVHNPGNIDSLVIENKKYLFNLLNDLINSNEERFLLMDKKELNFEKNIIFINDFLNLDPNDKKILNASLTELVSLQDKDKLVSRIALINSEIINLLDDMSIDLDCNVSYKSDITINDIFQIYKFKYDFSKMSLIERLVNYLKLVSKTIKPLFVITHNVGELLDIDDLPLLKDTLLSLNLHLIDISYKSNVPLYNNLIIIDKDLCRI